MSNENVPQLLAVMATAGLYDHSGQWVYRIHLPAKSGVGGGIIAVCHGRVGIALILPLLDLGGNGGRDETLSLISPMRLVKIPGS